ncbi:MAG: hypothetical protein LBS18_05530 [Clostridiales bacterium]|nr:hypothetical protein [Clostridiales bacterium]
MTKPVSKSSAKTKTKTARAGAKTRKATARPPETETEAGIERYAREKERATKRAAAQGPSVPVWVDPVTGKDGEVLTYRLNGVAYHIKTKRVVDVPEALAMVLYDQTRRKKLSARYVQEYTTGFGKGLGELK